MFTKTLLAFRPVCAILKAEKRIRRWETIMRRICKPQMPDTPDIDDLIFDQGVHEESEK